MRPAILTLLQCPRCGGAFDRRGDTLICNACTIHASSDPPIVDLALVAPARPSLGARAMGSAWMARAYEAWWRPLLFSLSTGFRMPPFEREVAMVLAHIGEAPGPWLDLSCGPGNLTRRLIASAGERIVVGVDLSTAMLKRALLAAPKADFVRADAMALPFADRTFGAVVNLAALDLYADARRAIREAARVLRPGGRWFASGFVGVGPLARDSALRRAVDRVTSVHWRSAERFAEMAKDAGLVRYEACAFGSYLVVCAQKP